MVSFSFFKRFLNVKCRYKKYQNAKIVCSIFGEGEQIKAFKVFNRIYNIL